MFVLRYFNACGSDGVRGERHEPETHLIPLVLDAAAGKREAVTIFGEDYPTPDGSCVRDYIHVSDLAAAHVAALEAPAPKAGHYNLGTGRGHSVKEVIATAEAVTGKKIPVVKGVARAGDPPIRVADPSLAKRQLGWRAERSLEDSIRSAWEFMRDSRH